MENRSRHYRELKNEALPLWEKTAAEIYIPAGTPEKHKTAAQRSISNLLLSRDKNTGAIVASPVRQPRYCCDWPRDGAFFDLALDLAGFHEAAGSHLEFYKKTQRRERITFSIARLASLKPPFFNPRGHWYPNMNCDGTPGSLKIIPFEIDETSLMVWDIWRHGLYVPRELSDEYRSRFTETLFLAMKAIMPFVDRKRGWIRKAIEDDDYISQTTLHGASAVLTALAGGAELARIWEFNPSIREEWSSAARSLKNGMLQRLDDPATFSNGGWRGIRWSLFPSPLFEGTGMDKRLPLLERLAGDMRSKAIDRRGGVGYLGEQLFIFAASSHDIREYDDLRKQLLDILINEVPVEGTGSYGELGLWIEHEGKRIIQNRTSIPHLWNGITVYLSILALREPYLFQRLRPPLNLQQ